MSEKSVSQKYHEQVYAGVLGKIIGVYLGRPVEGWPYEKIQEQFGEVDYYIHDKLKLPLIVADDDISGTFGFFRAMEEHGFNPNITSKDIGHTWLNNIIEDKTILWWGGLGRSTEHTAYLHLKNGIEAPESGSRLLNGPTLSNQIGAQIFIDAFAMMCPDDPEKAVYYIREAAQVSHDDLAVDAACFLGALEALAFSEKDVNSLLNKGLHFLKNKTLLKMIEHVREICLVHAHDWRRARADINKLYGYHLHDGPCHMVPNHAMVLASLLLGENDFHKSITIASSAAWDTDCNAGNIGCLNGIRLGLDAINEKVNLRDEVADRMLVVTADSGSCVTDAVLETRKILYATDCIYGQKDSHINSKRFAFDFPGSVQGFSACPYIENRSLGSYILHESYDKSGLAIQLHNCSDLLPFHISTPTFVDQKELIQNFATISSPTLYSGQVVETVIKSDNRGIKIRPYILQYDIHNNVQMTHGETFHLSEDFTQINWTMPNTDGMPIFRLGYQISADNNSSGKVIIDSIDWKGSPSEFAQKGVLMSSIWDTNPCWLQVWASSAKHFAPDFMYTYCISHPESNGVVTQGTRDWENYTIESNLMFSLHDYAGLVVRSVGHQRYYGAVFSEGKRVSILCRKDGVDTVLAEASFPYAQDVLYHVAFAAEGDLLTLTIGNERILEIKDTTYACGAAGYRIDKGTMLAENFIIRSV